MKLLDTNVLVYAANADAPQHARSRNCLEHALASAAGVGFTWMTLVGFIRISTSRGILAHPLGLEQALGVMKLWLSQPRARLLQPTDSHAELFSRLLEKAGVAGKLTNDAHLAALAMEHGATLVSFDHDFHRFDGLDFDWLKI